MGVLVVRVAADEAEACSDWLFQLGATAIEDRTAERDPTVIAGFDSDEAALAARSLLVERWPCRLEDTGDEREWRDRWLAYLKPIEVAGLLIHAPWHDVAAATSARVSIDPGRAFGSGHHPTTRLAIEALVANIEPDDSVLDAGCGTGILSIVAAQAGATRVVGADLDHDILAVAEANVEANGVGDRVELTEQPIADLDRRFDLTVANIVIGDLRPLLEPLIAHSDRIAVVTGFLDHQGDELINPLDCSILARTRLDGWGCAVLGPSPD